MNNLVTRTISSVVFVSLLLGFMLINKFLFAVLMLFICTVSLFEFFRMTMGKDYSALRYLGIFAGGLLFILMFLRCGFGMPNQIIGLEIIAVATVMITALFMKDKTGIKEVSYIYTGLLYIAVPVALSNILAFRTGEFNTMIILAFFILIWSSDVGAYLLGTAFGQKEGRKKLAPEISPKKSWVGFWGGLILCVIASVVLHFVGLFDFSLIHCFVLGIIVHCAGVCGDLVESLWKRQFGIKDSGNIIPGHGGLLDRFDSALIAIPLGSLYLIFANII